MNDNDIKLVPLNKTDVPGKRRHTGAGILIVTSINKSRIYC